MKQGDWVKQARCALPEYKHLGWVTENKAGGDGRVRQRKESRTRKLLAEICNDCPVMAECREFADKNFITLGVWGGKNYNYRFSVEA